MAGSQIERTFHLLEHLAGAARGVPLQTLAEACGLPKSAVHRMLAELLRLGYVRQNPENLRYQVSIRLVALGFRHLAGSGVDVVQPLLDQLASDTGELVRFGLVEGQRLTWIAKSQGARHGLRYDPDMGREAPLFYTASGHAWLAAMTDAQALALVEAQGRFDSQCFGPNAPRCNAELLERLRLAREQGYAWVVESAAVGMSALATVVRHPQRGEAMGVLSVAGPTARLSEVRMHGLAPRLLQAGAELSHAAWVSEGFV